MKGTARDRWGRVWEPRGSRTAASAFGSWPSLALFAAVFTVASSLAGQRPPGFENVAAKAGLTKVIPNGGEKTKTWVVETTGSGAALLDYDNDGLLDALLVSGPGGPSRL